MRNLVTSCWSSVQALKTEGKKKQDWERRRIQSFPVAAEVINQLMVKLLEHIREERVLRQKLFQANFHSTLSGEAMVSAMQHCSIQLLTHAVYDPKQSRSGCMQFQAQECYLV